MTKQDILKALEALPDDASIEDAMDALLYLHKIERGIKDVEAGRTISQAEVEARIAEWLR